MDSPCIKQTVCKVLNIFQHEKYLVAYVLKWYKRLIRKHKFEDQLEILLSVFNQLLHEFVNFVDVWDAESNAWSNCVY